MRPEIDRPFDQPWHASAFALSVHLNETGLFTWPEWTEKFSAILAQRGVDRDLDGSDDYYAAWLVTLQAILAEKKIADDNIITAITAQWKDAYLTTPHGQPVHLAAAETG